MNMYGEFCLVVGCIAVLVTGSGLVEAVLRWVTEDYDG